MQKGDSQDVVGYTVDEVRAIDNPLEAMTLLDDRGIPFEDLENLDDWKERLICHYNCELHGSPRKQVSINAACPPPPGRTFTPSLN